MYVKSVYNLWPEPGRSESVGKTGKVSSHGCVPSARILSAASLGDLG